MTTPGTHVPGDRGALARLFGRLDALLGAIAADEALGAGTRAAAQEAARMLPSALGEWQRAVLDEKRLHQQVAGLRAELNGLEATVGRVYQAMEEDVIER